MQPRPLRSGGQAISNRQDGHGSGLGLGDAALDLWPTLLEAWLRGRGLPGAQIPALSEIWPILERARLWVTDVEILRLHYAETLRHWRRRFLSNWEKVAAVHGDRFCRTWEFYLALAETLLKKGQPQQATLYLERVMQTFPGTRQAEAAQVRLSQIQGVPAQTVDGAEDHGGTGHGCFLRREPPRITRITRIKAEDRSACVALSLIILLFCLYSCYSCYSW